MPKKLSIAGAIEANRLSSDVPLLCLLDIQLLNPVTGEFEPPIHIARNPEPVTHRGVVYEAGMFDIEVSLESGAQGEVSLVVKDYTQALEAELQKHGGGVGSSVTYHIVNGGRLDDKPEVTEFFTVLSCQGKDYVQTFALGAENTLALTFPRRRQARDFCQWRYKSAECGYAGGMPTCSLTLKGPNGCQAHGNAINFGAYPGINSNGIRYV